MTLDSKQQGQIAKKLLDFYHDVYIAKFKEAPIILGGRDMKRIKDELLAYNDLSLDFLKACMTAYLDLEEAWLEENGFPLYIFPDKLYKCKQEVERNLKFFKGEKEDYYTNYVEKILIKLKLNEGGDRQSNTKPSGSDKD